MEEQPSKTQRKKAMEELQQLGEALVELSHEQLEKFALPENLRDAVLQAKRITKHEARRRQAQFIGRLMRAVDAAGIRAQIDRIQGKSVELIAFHHRLERWRERLLEDDAACEAFASEFPACDTQQLRQLIRNARKERAAHKPPKAFRQLYQMLKDATASREDSTQPPSVDATQP